MKDKSMSAGTILMLLTLAATLFLAGCGDFWEAPNGKTGTTASTTTLTATQGGSSVTTVAAGSSVTLTATVAASSGSGTPTGTVTFYNGATSLGTATLSSGTATLSPAPTFSTAGTFSLTADYSGDSTYAASTTSNAVSLVVTSTATFLLAANPTAPDANDLVTLTASVTPSPTGTSGETVTFFNGTPTTGTIIGTGTLSSGTTSIITSFSLAGNYSLTAVYGGDSTYPSSTSNTLPLTVGSSPSPTNCGFQDSSPNGVDATAAIAYTTSGDSTLNSPFITVSAGNESALCAEGSGTSVTVISPTIVSSSVGSNSTDSSYSGTNAAVLAYGTSGNTNTPAITITNGSVATTGNYGNGAFASGEGANISLNGTTITTGSSTDLTTAYASGVGAADGGSLSLTQVSATTYGPNSPAIFSGLGAGTINITDGTYTANNAEAVVVDGLNVVNLTGATLSSTMGNYRGILFYLSTGPSSAGPPSFTMTGGSLTYTCDATQTATASCATGDLANGTSSPATLFAVAGTTAAITLIDVPVTNDTPITPGGNGTLLEAEAFNNSTVPSNVTFTAKGETLTGDVIVDAVSTAALTLNEDTSKTGSKLTGAINNAGSAGTVSLALDSASSWTVTATSNLANLTDPSISGTAVSNIDGGGHCVFYSGTVNGTSGTIYTLSGTNGGYLAPTGTPTSGSGITCN
jgi:hypothetical protein